MIVNIFDMIIEYKYIFLSMCVREGVYVFILHIAIFVIFMYDFMIYFKNKDNHSSSFPIIIL